MFFAVTVDEIETKCTRDDAGVLHCYKLYADSVTIFWAKANCASLGQHLVTISSKEEFEFVTNYIKERETVCNVHCYSHDHMFHPVLLIFSKS